jgi:hypothetical protein
MEQLQLPAESPLSLSIITDKEPLLRSLVEEYSGLSIDGVDDKEGFKKVDDARKRLKQERVQLEKDGYNTREKAIAFQKAVIEKERSLVSIIKPLEDKFLSMTQKVNEEKERIKKEKEEAENRRIQARIDALNQYNYAVDYSMISKIDDQEFEIMLSNVKADYEEEQKKIAAKKAEEEEARRQEEERLKAERIEIERLRKEHEEKEKALAEEREQIRKQQEEEQRKIQAENDRKQREFEEEQRKIREENARIASELKAREAELKRQENERIAAEKAKAEEEARLKRKEEEKIERERLAKIEAERKEQLKPDKQKLNELAASITNDIKYPALTHSSSNEVCKWVQSSLFEIAKQLVDKAENL